MFASLGSVSGATVSGTLSQRGAAVIQLNPNPAQLSCTVLVSPPRSALRWPLQGRATRAQAAYVRQVG